MCIQKKQGNKFSETEEQNHSQDTAYYIFCDKLKYK